MHVFLGTSKPTVFTCRPALENVNVCKGFEIKLKKVRVLGFYFQNNSVHSSAPPQQGLQSPSFLDSQHLEFEQQQRAKAHAGHGHLDPVA